MKIFISGKVTGNSNYKNEFDNAEKYLKTRYPSAIIFNPAILPMEWGAEACMRVCHEMLSCCDIIYMLENWKTSKGATLEHDWAKYVGKVIIYSYDS